MEPADQRLDGLAAGVEGLELEVDAVTERLVEDALLHADDRRGVGDVGEVAEPGCRWARHRRRSLLEPSPVLAASSSSPQAAAQQAEGHEDGEPTRPASPAPFSRSNPMDIVRFSTSRDPIPQVESTHLRRQRVGGPSVRSCGDDTRGDRPPMSGRRSRWSGPRGAALLRACGPQLGRQRDRGRDRADRQHRPPADPGALRRRPADAGPPQRALPARSPGWSCSAGGPRSNSATPEPADPRVAGRIHRRVGEPRDPLGRRGPGGAGGALASAPPLRSAGG